MIFYCLLYAITTNICPVYVKSDHLIDRNTFNVSTKAILPKWNLVQKVFELRKIYLTDTEGYCCVLLDNFCISVVLL